jgi:hypothetical protein
MIQYSLTGALFIVRATACRDSSIIFCTSAMRDGLEVSKFQNSQISLCSALCQSFRIHSLSGPKGFGGSNACS